MKKIVLSVFVFLFYSNTVIAAEPDVRYREMTVVIDQIHGERKDHLVFEQGTTYVEPVTFIASEELSYVVTIDIPGDLTNKKLWDIKVVAVSLHGKDVVEVIKVKNLRFTYDKEKNITRNVIDVETTQSSHTTFYYHFRYKGKDKIEIPWGFDVGSLREFTNRKNITYKVKVTEVK